MNPFTLRVAFGVEGGGGSGSPASSILVFLRDPWGVTLQLCQRPRPLP